MVIVVAGCGGSSSSRAFASGHDIASAIHCTDYSEEQTGPVSDSGGKAASQAKALASFVRTIGYCNLFNQEIQTDEVVNIIMFKASGDAAKLDVSLRSLCPLFQDDPASGAARTLRGDDWEVFLERDRPGLQTLEKIKSMIGGSEVDLSC